MIKNVPFLRPKALREILRVGSKNGMGTPQGGILSPALANYTLHDLGKDRGSKYMRYADDFIVFCND